MVWLTYISSSENTISQYECSMHYYFLLPSIPHRKLNTCPLLHREFQPFSTFKTTVRWRTTKIWLAYQKLHSLFCIIFQYMYYICKTYITTLAFIHAFSLIDKHLRKWCHQWTYSAHRSAYPSSSWGSSPPPSHPTHTDLSVSRWGNTLLSAGY